MPDHALDLVTAAVATSPGSTKLDQKLRVFISYSRADLAFADQLDAALDAYGFECSLDRQGISGGEDWKTRLGALLHDADTVVFVLSPDSAKSEVCVWEVETAAHYGKRIIPIVCRPLENQPAPKRLVDLNYIFFYPEPKFPGSGFGAGLAQLVAALNTDLDWLREHTRYLQRASEWEKGGRIASRMLSGSDIADAKSWVARRPKNAPEPTPLQLDYIRASEAEESARGNAERRRLEQMAAAQAERQDALVKAEQALKAAAFAQKRRATIRNIAMAVVLAISAVTFYLWRVAVQERQEAQLQRQLAEQRHYHANTILDAATDVIGNVTRHYDLDDDTKAKVANVFQRGSDMGSVPATANLGWVHLTGTGVGKDPVKARQYFEDSAAKGDLYSMTTLAQLYLSGEGGRKEPEKARRLLQSAMTQNYGRAFTEMGVMHYRAKEFDDAMKHFRLAGDRGDPQGLNNLAVMNYFGIGVPVSFETSRCLWLRAAESDEADAYNGLGWLLDNGLSGPVDHQEGAKLLLKSASMRSAVSRLNLGDRYMTGWGVPRDLDQARAWYERAALVDEDEARLRLDRLPVEIATDARNFAEALKLQAEVMAQAEALDMKLEEKPDVRLAEELGREAFIVLLAGETARALELADKGLARFPDGLSLKAKRAHALMLLGRTQEAVAIYDGHLYEVKLSEFGKPWQRFVKEDFARMRRMGLLHPLMAEVEPRMVLARQEPAQCPR